MKKEIIAMLAALTLAACGGGDDDKGSSTPALTSVSYSVTTNGSTASVTYAVPSGGTEQTTTASFSKFYFCNPGDFLYVSGQTNGSSAFSSVTATISVSGRPAITRTSTGAFSIATASATC